MGKAKRLKGHKGQNGRGKRELNRVYSTKIYYDIRILWLSKKNDFFVNRIAVRMYCNKL